MKHVLELWGCLDVLLNAIYLKACPKLLYSAKLSFFFFFFYGPLTNICSLKVHDMMYFCWTIFPEVILIEWVITKNMYCRFSSFLFTNHLWTISEHRSMYIIHKCLLDSLDLKKNKIKKITIYCDQLSYSIARFCVMCILMAYLNSVRNSARQVVGSKSCCSCTEALAFMLLQVFG